MHKVIFILFILYNIVSFGQNDSDFFSCKEIETYKSIDNSLYDSLPNGKLIFAAYKAKSKLFRIVIISVRLKY